MPSSLLIFRDCCKLLLLIYSVVESLLQYILYYIRYRHICMSNKLNISDLLASLPGSAKKSQQKQQKIHNVTNSVSNSKFAQSVLRDQNKKVNILSRKQQEMMRRQTNYQMAKEDMDKWVGIVKMNRQKQSLNFTNKDVGNMNVNFFPTTPVSDFHKKIQAKLTSMNIQSQKSVMKHEQAVLEKVDPEEAKRRLIEARKHRTAVFYQEQKRRRIAKIKSKLYHKIKKRQKQRQELKKVDQMTPQQKTEYIQKLTKQRIKQRITLRHNTKTKHIQNLLRFNRNQKNSIQKQINDINDIRHKQMQRLNQQMIDQMENGSQDYDDQNFRDQAMRDLQKQIQEIENREGKQGQEEEQGDQIDRKLNDLKFIKNAKEKRIKKDKQDAYKLLDKLAAGKQIKQKDVNSDIDSEQMPQENSQQENSDEQKEHAQRKIYGKKVKQDIDDNKKKNNKSIDNELKNYLLGGSAQNQQKRNQVLTKGINVDNLKNKYQPQRVAIDLASLIAQNKDIYDKEANEAVLENVREFQQQKYAEIQQEYNRTQQASKGKQLKGWGSWTGPGLKQRKVDPQEELKKKLQKIEQIKRKRKDNALAHVTISQSRNKNLSDYFVRDLPHNFANADQFDYMQSEPIGPQWNSLNQFKDNIKPKVITKAGQVITPVKLPRAMTKKSKTK